MKGKRFTVEQANAALPELRAALEAIRDVKQSLGASADLEVLWNKARTNGGGKEGRTYMSGLEQISEKLNVIAHMGVMLRDIDTGLCDFPSIREGREIFLCWKADEDAIRFWHDRESGFGGRQRL